MVLNKQILKQIMTYIKNGKGFERHLDKILITNIGDGKCTAEYEVAEGETNIVGALHGGFSATLVDTISSYALFSHPKASIPSVSVDMHLTYLKAAKMGDVIIIDAKTNKTGKTLAYLDVEIKQKSTGDILVKGSHTKFLLQPKE